ncbi:FAR1 DNA binding domain, FHY3/FAR1 family [Artemisia annua]|uniref:FAR1 DNA binding domain, FHY3/FAR1 family n=1 Tax=Artemisia annua TaxID=35608 RepID=A0A2U1PXT8_ARTAN|nr:FAR1 DNA binding domain, FHY3/FAR1 family [Artemisia annua]
MVDIVDIVHDSHAEDDIVVQEQNDQILLLTEQDLIMDSDHHPQVDNTKADVVDVYDIDPEFIPTPNGHTYWVPDVPVDEKPIKGTRFNTFEEAVNMYKVYAAKARFGVCKSGSKKWRGEVTHKHVICNRGGKPRKIVETNTLNEDVNQHAQEDDNVDGTKWYELLDFVENHNHPLIDPSNMDLSRAQRKLQYGDYMFIHRASLSNIGPQKAHRLRVALLGETTAMQTRCLEQYLGSDYGGTDLSFDEDISNANRETGASALLQNALFKHFVDASGEVSYHGFVGAHGRLKDCTCGIASNLGLTIGTTGVRGVPEDHRLMIAPSLGLTV